MSESCVIRANPDVAGIGIRVSFYVMSLTSLVAPALAIARAHLKVLKHATSSSHDTALTLSPTSSAREEIGVTTPPNSKPESFSITKLRRTRTVSLTNMMTACALLLSAILQVISHEGLTAYHAAIVLNMVWMSVFTAFWSCFAALVVDLDLKLGFFSRTSKNISWTTRSITPFLHDFGLTLSLFLVTASAMGAVGIWTWATISTFGGPELAICNPSIIYSIFGKNVAITNPSFQAFSLRLYILAAIPILNWLLMLVVQVIFGLIITIAYVIIAAPFVIFGYYFSVPARDRFVLWSKQFYFGVGGLMALTLAGIIMWDVVLIVSTEYMITRNNVASGEGNWTFSQTLALGVLGVPLWDVVSNIRRGIEEDKPRGACNCTGVEDKEKGITDPI